MSVISADRDGGDVATAVLTDSMLFRRIAAFQSGYPQVVAAMILASTKAPLEYLLSDVVKKRIGALPRLAVATGDFEILKLLFKLKTRVEYHNDLVLQFVDVMRIAVLRRNLEMLDCLVELKSRDPKWQHWEPNLMSHVLHFDGGDVRVLEWLYMHLPRDMCELQEGYMDLAMRFASVDVIQWLFEHGYEISSGAADCGASKGNVDALTYLYEHTDVRCSPIAFWESAARGSLKVLKIILTDDVTKETYERAINAAARRGQLKVVKYFVERGIGVSSPTVIDEAVHGGYLGVVQYLHEHLPRSSAPVMTVAGGDRLENDVLLLSSHTKKTTSTGCTAHALELAAMSRQLDVVKFLCEHRSEGDIGAVMAMVTAKGYLEVVKILHKHRRCQDSAFLAVRAAAQVRRKEVVKFLCESQEQEEDASSRFLAQAMADGANWLVQAVAPFSTLAELTQARDIAVEQQRRRNRQNLRILERFIYQKEARNFEG